MAVILAFALLIAVGTCFYTVDDKLQAVITTFGNVYQKIELGYRTEGTADYSVVEE